MSGTEKSHAALLDELAALDPAERREVAKELRRVAENFAEVPDGRHTAHALRLLAQMLDPSVGQ
jgi:hypothetical protein